MCNHLARVFSYVLTALLICGVSYADTIIYGYVDENGAYHFSQQRIDHRYKRIRLWKNIHYEEEFRKGAYDEVILRAGKKYGVEPELIKAIIRAESDFNRRAKSRAGAMGLMQLMPSTAKILKVEDPYDPEKNIEGGVRYFRYLRNLFKGDLLLALAAYNAGPDAVKKYNGIPPYPETQEYVKRVLRYYRAYLSL